MAGAGEVGLIVLQALWLMLPAYLSNMSAVFVGGGAPIDGGRVWRDGKRVLGPGKTWRGLLLAPLVGALLTTFVLHHLAHAPALTRVGFNDFGPALWGVFVLAYFMGFGALFGDAVESFFKRRVGKERGAPWFPFDQLDFVLGAWLWVFIASLLLLPAYGYNWFTTSFTPWHVLVILVLTPGLHFVVNVIGYKIGKKEVPW